VIEVVEFDGSVALLLEKEKLNISREVAKHILITKN
jgi:DtxR family Mn-dependent transcriptional regulator